MLSSSSSPWDTTHACHSLLNKKRHYPLILFLKGSSCGRFQIFPKGHLLPTCPRKSERQYCLGIVQPPKRSARLLSSCLNWAASELCHRQRFVINILGMVLILFHCLIKPDLFDFVQANYSTPFDVKQWALCSVLWKSFSSRWWSSWWKQS